MRNIILFSVPLTQVGKHGTNFLIKLLNFTKT